MAPEPPIIPEPKPNTKPSVIPTMNRKAGGAYLSHADLLTLIRTDLFNLLVDTWRE